MLRHYGGKQRIRPVGSHARARLAAKRGKGERAVPLESDVASDSGSIPTQMTSIGVLSLDVNLSYARQGGQRLEIPRF